MVINKALLIFDLDDTLVHSRIDFVTLGQWVRGELVRRGLTELPEAELVRMSVSQMLKLAEDYDGSQSTGHAAELWRKVEEAELAGAMRATVEDGAQAVLKSLKANGYLLSILTNNSRRVADTVLERFGLGTFIHTVMTRDEAKVLKPDPTGLLMLKDKYKDQVARMFYIGDAWIDGMAANRAGIPFIGFNCNDPRGISMVGNVSNLPELARLVEDICSAGEGDL
ncbi:MAG: HAD family hydrolase [Clostridia bacterium]|jgi:phosphoglycolate phosphatase|nr:HAD family hydrolase [Clostridia bacterium]